MILSPLASLNQMGEANGAPPSLESPLGSGTDGEAVSAKPGRTGEYRMKISRSLLLWLLSPDYRLMRRAYRARRDDRHTASQG